MELATAPVGKNIKEYFEEVEVCTLTFREAKQISFDIWV